MSKQKILIFIDTNIYLRFCEAKQSNFKKLLKSVGEISDNIFITQQIRDEIDRNKQNLFRNSFDGYINQTRINSVKLPDHLSADVNAQIEDWNNQRLKVEEMGKDQTEKLKEISAEILNRIQKDEDDLSQVLITLKVEEPNEEILVKAKRRKDFGNPPGKKDDPIGDEINWEQLIEFIGGNSVEELIILSTDNDYFINNNGQLQLNAKLYKELTQMNESINIYCYGSLADGLKKFNELKQIKNLPTDEELEIIKEEEEKSLAQNVQMATTIYGQMNPFAQPIYGQVFPSNQPYSTILSNPVFLPTAGSFEASTTKHCPKCGHFTFEVKNFELHGNESYRNYECSNCGYTERLPSFP